MCVRVTKYRNDDDDDDDDDDDILKIPV